MMRVIQIIIDILIAAFVISVPIGIVYVTYKVCLREPVIAAMVIMCLSVIGVGIFAGIFCSAVKYLSDKYL